jgi:hypothetical protein
LVEELERKGVLTVGQLGMLKACDIYDLSIATAERGPKKVEIAKWRVADWLRKTARY